MPQDGERLLLVCKDLASADVYPTSIAFDPTGRSVVVCGDGKFVVYTAIAWRHKSFGAADEYVWGVEKLCVVLSVFDSAHSPTHTASLFPVSVFVCVSLLFFEVRQCRITTSPFPSVLQILALLLG